MKPIMVSLFPISAISLAMVAYFYPAVFIGAKVAIIPLLALVMFTMGMTLTWKHFQEVLARPVIIAIAVSIQFLLMPLFAYGISLGLNLPAEQMVGMVLVGSSAGGTASNVICYLARGNVALSILMTLCSTLCAVLLMPLLTYLYLHQTVPVPLLPMLKSIVLMVLIPVLLGVTINSYFRHQLDKVQSVFPIIYSLSIIIIIAIIVAINHNNLTELSLPVFTGVVLHNVLGLTAGYWIPRSLKFDAITCRTVCIEVGMQNSGLSVALAVKYFSTLAALPGALFSIWHNISGTALAAYWVKNPDPGETGNHD